MIVLDSSAIIALISEEKGGLIVKQALQDKAVINTVNYAEILKYFNQYGYDTNGLVNYLLESGLSIHDFSKAEAEISGEMFQLTKPFGLSIGDRACLATAINLNLELLTADRIWARINFPELKINLIR